MEQKSNRPVDWEALLLRNENHMYRAALALLGNREEARDAVQDALVIFLEIKLPQQEVYLEIQHLLLLQPEAFSLIIPILMVTLYFQSLLSNNSNLQASLVILQ